MNKKTPIHDKDCELLKGKKCSCVAKNKYLTEDYRKKLEEKGFFEKLFFEDLNS